MKTWGIAASSAVALAATAMASPALAASDEKQVEWALGDSPVWDGHNDVPIQLRGRFLNQINDFDFENTTNTGSTRPDGREMHTDLNRLRQGMVGAQFWSVYVTADLDGPHAVQAVMEQIDVTKRLVDMYPDDLAFATSSREVEQAIRDEKIASLIGMEGGHSINGSLAVLRQFYDLGARYMTLTHSKNTPWADSATDEPEHGGLTAFGQDVVREMQRIGMLVDLSHTSADTMHDVLDIAGAPIMFSHSGSRAINGHARNVPDDVLVRVRDNGGIVMVVGEPGFVSEERRLWTARRAAVEAAAQSLHRGNPEQVKANVDAWEAENPAPLSTISQLADHIDHIRDVAGIDNVGIGADYDGMATGPQGMEDVSGYPKLFEELARRGYNEVELEKVASLNMMRVLKEAERYAEAHKNDRVIEGPLAE
jgi:membrane dipeptidase